MDLSISKPLGHCPDGPQQVEPRTGPQMVKPRTAAEMVGLHPNTIYNAIYRGDLKAYRYGARAIRINVADLLALFTPYVGGEYGVWKSAGVR